MKFKQTDYKMFFLVDEELTPIGCIGYTVDGEWVDIGMVMASKKSPSGTAVELINRIEFQTSLKKFRVGTLANNVAMEKSLLRCGYKKIKDGRFEKEK